MDDITKILRDSTYMTLGIAPITDSHHDINRVLASLPPDEARRMRRKFRKMWRKFAKQNTSAAADTYLAKSLGLGEKVPTRRNKIARKARVTYKVMHDVVLPLVDKVNTGGVKSPPRGV